MLAGYQPFEQADEAAVIDKARVRAQAGRSGESSREAEQSSEKNHFADRRGDEGSVR